MATAELETHYETLDELIQRLGGVPLNRIRLHPALGTATEEDLLRLTKDEAKGVELVDGVFVEKAVGYFQSTLATILIIELGNYLRKNPIGRLATEDGPFQLRGGQIRKPDVSLVLFSSFPEGMTNELAHCPVAPDLAVEILSPGNRPQEMARKLGEYFQSGTKVVWVVDCEQKTARIHYSTGQSNEITEERDLIAESVAPGFRLNLGAWFREAERLTPPPSDA